MPESIPSTSDHWLNWPRLNELNPPNLDRMTPDQFYFNTNTRHPNPKTSWPRKDPAYCTLDLDDQIGEKPLYLHKLEINFPSLVFE
jgi:hypothetical protein